MRKKTQRMPLSTSLGSRQGLPRPSARRGGSGISGSKTSHCSSVRSIFLLDQENFAWTHFTVYEMASRQDEHRWEAESEQESAK